MIRTLGMLLQAVCPKRQMYIGDRWNSCKKPCRGVNVRSHAPSHSHRIIRASYQLRSRHSTPGPQLPSAGRGNQWLQCSFWATDVAPMDRHDWRHGASRGQVPHSFKMKDLAFNPKEADDSGQGFRSQEPLIVRPALPGTDSCFRWAADKKESPSCPSQSMTWRLSPSRTV